MDAFEGDFDIFQENVLSLIEEHKDSVLEQSIADLADLSATLEITIEFLSRYEMENEMIVSVITSLVKAIYGVGYQAGIGVAKEE